jgi:hypothetical protein
LETAGGRGGHTSKAAEKIGAALLGPFPADGLDEWQCPEPSTFLDDALWVIEVLCTLLAETTEAAKTGLPEEGTKLLHSWRGGWHSGAWLSPRAEQGSALCQPVLLQRSGRKYELSSALVPPKV